jgi:fumarate hydratase subunit alpha
MVVVFLEIGQDVHADINMLGIGPQGLGGRVTAFDVHIETYPTHIGSIPVAINLQCHCPRHKESVRGSRPYHV